MPVSLTAIVQILKDRIIARVKLDMMATRLNDVLILTNVEMVINIVEPFKIVTILSALIHATVSMDMNKWRFQKRLKYRVELPLSQKNQELQVFLVVWISTNASKIMDVIDLRIAQTPLVHMSAFVILVIMEMVEHVSRSMHV